MLGGSNIELPPTNASDELLTDESALQVHSIDTAMSAPTIDIVENSPTAQLSGHGLALADVAVEQDQAYWEWRVNIQWDDDSESKGSGAEVMVGVSNKRNAKFYEILAGSTIPPVRHGTKFMAAVPDLRDGDIVGVVVQQSELPMIQLYVNGKLVDGLTVARFRGMVFPALFLPELSGGTMTTTFLYRENQFFHGPPDASIEPLIAVRSLT